MRFKKVHPKLPIYSVRINKDYRAVGQLDEDSIVWFWVGSHAEYDLLLDNFGSSLLSMLIHAQIDS